jgi:2-keto-3-deoxy-L-rhamnonate aldolase RhmA
VDVDDEAWASKQNEEILLIGIVEEAMGLQHLDDILMAEGLDLVHVGPKDLWQSLGMPKQDIVDDAVDSIIASAVRAQIWPSLYLRPTEPNFELALQRRLAQGVRMFTVPAYDLVKATAQPLLHTFDSVRGSLQSKRPEG